MAVSKVDERWALVPPPEGPEDTPVFPPDPRLPALATRPASTAPVSRVGASGPASRQPASQVHGRNSQDLPTSTRSSELPTWVPDSDFSVQALLESELCESEATEHEIGGDDRPTIPSPPPPPIETVPASQRAGRVAKIVAEAPDTIPTPWIDEEPSGV